MTQTTPKKPSLQTYLVNTLLRIRLKKGLKTKSGMDAKRRVFDQSGRRLAKTKGLEIDQIQLAGVPAERLSLDTQEADYQLLYLHGGAYSAGSPTSHRPLTAELARTGNACVYALDYRLAPENPFPAAIDDALSAYQYLQQHEAGASPIVLAGSAGGGLCLALLQKIKQSGLKMPIANILYSPWTDLTISGQSVIDNEQSCAMLTPSALKLGAELYLNGADPKDPLATPIFGDFSGCTPTLVFVSDSELLRDDALRMVKILKRDGVETQMQIVHGQAHVWPLFHRFLPEGKLALRQSAAFIRSKLPH